MTTNLPEVWLRGPIENVPSLLQPVAHTLMQAVEEVKKIMEIFPDKLLWKRPAEVASPGFHLQHMAGVIDRLSTYAQGKTLSESQMAYLQNEGKEISITSPELVRQFEEKVNDLIKLLRTTDEATLTTQRSVGRKALPSTVMGLLFHAAEHTMRHVGQLLVTVRVIKNTTE
ncbi:MAG: DinB family protein [Flavisolibacter sp.]